MTGILYGVGIGPGDPELLTAKAIRLIRENEVIAVPGEHPEDTIAFQIAVQAVPEVEKKELLGIAMPMSKDKNLLEQYHQEGARVLEEYLRRGKNVVFLTLGDPTVYSTYLYLHRIVKQDGFATEIVPGVTSFCAAAAALSMGLVETSEELHVIPASYQIEEALTLKGTKVLMKAGKKIGQVKQKLLETGCEVQMVENCGMKKERTYQSAEEIPEEAGYYSLMIIKERKQ